MRSNVFVLFVLFALCVSGNAAPLSLSVITLSTLTVPTIPSAALPQGTTVAVYPIDAVAIFNQRLHNQSLGLSHSETIQRVRQAFAQQHAALHAATTGLALSKKIGVMRAPAIIINQHFIVYGTLNVLAALTQYHTYCLAGGDRC